MGLRAVHGQQSADLRVTPWNGGPVVRPPIWTPPTWLIVLVQVCKFCGRCLRACARHPVVTGLAVGLVVLVARYGWTTTGLVVAGLAGLLGVWAGAHWPTFTRFVVWPVWATWRRMWVYRRHWRSAMVLTGLAVEFAEREYIPRLGRVVCARHTDHVAVHLVSGQEPEQWERASAALAHTFGAVSCRVRVAKPRRVWLEFTRTDPLTTPVPALDPVNPVDLAALPLGVREDGQPWLLNLTGTHLLVAGASGAGKGSVVWSLLRALGPAVASGHVAPWVLDPKGGMELWDGQAMFARFEADDYTAMADLLDEAVELMDERTRRLRGVTRQHEPTPTDPLILVVVDEMANLTAYLQDSGLRKRIGKALSLLLSKGRAVGVHVVGALQDPRKDVLPFRDLFPTRIALRLTEAAQVDMVLGDGARDRGALCDRIPRELPGVGYVVLDGEREPVRVRAAYVADEDIRQMAAEFPCPHRVVIPDGMPLIPRPRETSE